MNKKILSALLLGALTVASTGTLVSCKDYDDDINHLQDQINENTDAIAKINELIKNGGVITSVTPVENGVKVTLSNDKDFTITNGKDGKDGVAGKDGVTWTISEDGNWWVKDGEQTTYPARGEKGEKGEPGKDGQDGKDATGGAAGENGKYYVPNADTGCFDIYKDGKLVESTNISFLGSGVITAVKDDAKKTLTLYGVKGGAGENGVVVISMSGTLSSLSYRPELYLDGIETIEYAWLSGNTMKAVAAQATENFQGKTVKLGTCNDYVADTKAFVYGPAWAVDYDASPWNAAVNEEDLAGYNVLNPTAIYTRAVAAGDATSPAYAFPGKDKGGKKLFSMNNGTGVLTAGLQFANPDKLPDANPIVTNGERNSVNTVALRVKNSEGTEVVADYALVQPEKTTIDGLIWNQEAKCIDENAKEQVRTGDEKCPTLNNELKHVWDSPEKALTDTRGATLSLYYEDEVGVDLSQYVAVRLVKAKNLKANEAPEYINVTPKDALQWGLTFHYNIIDYTLDTNETSESMFLKKVDANQDNTCGKFRAQNVKENLAAGEAANASVGRMPLVQVTVTNDKGVEVLDGYILLYITKYAETNGKNENWKEQETTFDPCNANDVFTTTWNQFNDLMLTQFMDMTKETFDHQYEADLDDEGAMKQFAGYKDKGEQDVNANALGTVFYKANEDGNTNHTWRWTIPAEDIEAKLHHSDSYTFTTWVRYKAIDKKAAKYPYIYIKLTAKVNNKKTNTYTFGDKNDNYWFSLSNNDVVIFDVLNPTDGGDIQSINRSVRSTLLKNKESFNAPQHRYYFAPEEVKITAQDGTVYTLSPAAGNANYNKVVCLYVSEKHDYKDAATVLKTCALDINAGAYVNKELYANSKKIATIDPTTGEIKLINNKECQDVLNAIGYAQNHANALKQLRAHVGVVTANACGVVEETTNDKFVASWLRPINVIGSVQPAVDANTNGNWIDILDCVKLYDWRGYINNGDNDADYVANQSNMWGGNYWFWAYYGVKGITLDLSNDVVETTMHYGTWKKLSEVTSFLSFGATNPTTSTQIDMNKKVSYTFSLNNMSYSSKNADVLAKLQAAVGKLYYTNNGDVVKPFQVKVPVTISYEWGEVNTEVTITIDPTIGHN